MRVENQTKTQTEKTRFYAQKPRLKMLFKNSISGHKFFKTIFFFTWSGWQGSDWIVRRAKFSLNLGELRIWPPLSPWSTSVGTEKHKKRRHSKPSVINHICILLHTVDFIGNTGELNQGRDCLFCPFPVKNKWKLFKYVWKLVLDKICTNYLRGKRKQFSGRFLFLVLTRMWTQYT
jgi:hypothetical protein